MSDRLAAVLEFVRRAVAEPLARLGAVFTAVARQSLESAYRFRARTVIALLLAVCVYALYAHPPFASVPRGEVLVRTNLFDGSSTAYTAGTVLVLPGIHQVRSLPTRDQLYQPTESASATGKAPFQSNEGLSVGVDLTVRWAIDRARIAQMAKAFPDDLNADLVRPAVQGIVYPLLARHSVREIFSGQRVQIQPEITAELAPKLAALGLVLRGVDPRAAGECARAARRLWPLAGRGVAA